MSAFVKPTEEMVQLLAKASEIDSDSPERTKAALTLAKAFALPLREAVFSGDIYGDIFSVYPLRPGQNPEFPLDLIAPGTERDYVAYSIPNAGYIPQRKVESDYVTLHTYRIGNAIDWDIKFSRDANWNVVGRAMEVFEAGIVKKLNDDGWHILLASAVDRNILVYDSAAAAGQFSKRLVSLMKTVMRRNGGGNSASMNRYKLTDLYMSPEGEEDIRDWGVDQLDEVSRREVYTAADGTISRIFGVMLNVIDELGVGQEYQTYATTTLGGALQASDVELVIGLDKSKGTFIMPTRENFFVREDATLHRWQKQGFYGWGEVGFVNWDNRAVAAGSF